MVFYVLSKLGGVFPKASAEIMSYICRDEWDFIKNGGGADDPLADVTNKAKGLGAGVYNLLLTIGIIGLVASIMWLAISLALNKNAQKREANKEWMVWIAVAGIILFGAFAIIGLIAGIGKGLEATSAFIIISRAVV